VQTDPPRESGRGSWEPSPSTALPIPVPDRPARLPWRRFWLFTGPAFLLAGILVSLLPLDAKNGGTTQPPLQLLFLMALAVGLVTLTAVYLVVRGELHLPASVALMALTFEGLVVGVKFVAGPAALYEANKKSSFQQFFPLSEGAGAVTGASLVFALYAGVLLLVYRHARRRTGMFTKAARRLRASRPVMVALLVGGVLFATTVGTGLLVAVAVVGDGGFGYISDVFTGSAALLVAVVLAIATAVATKAFRDVADRAVVLRDTSVLVAFFWASLAFLALYHVLWVVYILVLTSVWPLKVVTPK
jgi:hypothetical protein